MKKKLYFDKTFNIGKSLYILIDSGKLREYDGADFTGLILQGIQPIFKIYYLNSNFKLSKVSKYDRRILEIKGNYKIESFDLTKFIIKDTYIKLNFVEKFLIDYSKKEDIFHKMNFNQKLILFLIFTVIPLIIGLGWNKWFRNDNKTNNMEQTIDSTEFSIIGKQDSINVDSIEVEIDSISNNEQN